MPPERGGERIVPNAETRRVSARRLRNRPEAPVSWPGTGDTYTRFGTTTLCRVRRGPDRRRKSEKIIACLILFASESSINLPVLEFPTWFSSEIPFVPFRIQTPRAPFESRAAERTVLAASPSCVPCPDTPPWRLP